VDFDDWRLMRLSRLQNSDESRMLHSRYIIHKYVYYVRLIRAEWNIQLATFSGPCYYWQSYNFSVLKGTIYSVSFFIKKRMESTKLLCSLPFPLIGAFIRCWSSQTGDGTIILPLGNSIVLFCRNVKRAKHFLKPKFSPSLGQGKDGFIQ
jgi:hypothetical protein